MFADIRVRQALTLLFDFQWINRNYFFGLYARSAGFFAGSELSAYGRPADDRERELLKPFASHIPPDILDGSYRLPVTDGSGRDRVTLRSALTLLSQAGYELDGTVCGNDRPRRPSPLKSWSRRATRNASRWPISVTSSARASRSRCARSMPCSSTSAGSASIST